jgi:HD-like signal output (HDOD) protein
LISITCPGCKKTYKIPDSEIPKEKPVDLLCPACNTVLTLRPGKTGTSSSNKDSQPGYDPELMEKIVQTSKALPPMPQIIARASEVLSSDNAGFREISQVLETDQAMATRVLRIANSAYYGVSVPVTSVQQASALLGFQTLFELITVVSSSKMMGKRLDGYGIDAKIMWKHSLSVAVGAKAVSEKYYPELVSDAFMVGLIHDSGMILLDSYIEKNKKKFNELVSQGKTFQEAEKEIFGFDHAALSAQYLKKWKLPATLTHAIGFHHRPFDSGEDHLSCILHIADAMANADHGPEPNFTAEQIALEVTGIQEDETGHLAEEMETMVEGIIESMEA